MKNENLAPDITRRARLAARSMELLEVGGFEAAKELLARVQVMAPTLEDAKAVRDLSQAFRFIIETIKEFGLPMPTETSQFTEWRRMAAKTGGGTDRKPRPIDAEVEEPTEPSMN